jgi:hypothetical protein
LEAPSSQRVWRSLRRLRQGAPPRPIRKPALTEASKATDLGARRRNRHVRHYAYRPNDRPYYYDRPYDYRPYPYQAPVPFFLGFGFGPSW